MVNHVKGRPDRIAAAEARDELNSVFNEILRYESDHGKLPGTLGELVPRYVQQEQVYGAADAPIYVYLPEARVIGQREGSRVRGLWRYRMNPFERQIPPVGSRAQFEPPVRSSGVPAAHSSDRRAATLPELCFVPLDFSGLDLDGLPMREYLLTAVLKLEDGTQTKSHVPLMKPFDWEVAGPKPFLSNSVPGPLDGDKAPADDAYDTWQPFKDEAWDHFGVLDFGVQTSGNSANAPRNRTIYGRTLIEVPRAGRYLMKVQADDQMLLWINGELVYRHDYQRPVTRAAFAEPILLEAGVHRVRFRVNQFDGKWQASLRFRTEADTLSDIVGRPVALSTADGN